MFFGGKKGNQFNEDERSPLQTCDMPGRGGHDGRAFKKGPSLPGMSHVYVPLLRQAVGGWGSGTSRRRRRPGRSSTGLTAVGNGGCGLPMCPTTGPGPPLGGKLPCFPPLPDPPHTPDIQHWSHSTRLVTAHRDVRPAEPLARGYGRPYSNDACGRSSSTPSSTFPLQISTAPCKHPLSWRAGYTI